MPVRSWRLRYTETIIANTHFMVIVPDPVSVLKILPHLMLA